MLEMKKLMMLFSIVEQGKGKKLIKTLESKDVKLHFQLVGFGTAPTEMMDILGLGSNDKDIIVSLAAKKSVNALMADFGSNFASYSQYGGLMLVLDMSASTRLLTEMLHHKTLETEEKEGAEGAMKNEHKHDLIFITVDQGFSDQVMRVAKQAGATGGTIIKGRIADTDMFIELAEADVEPNREIICIMAPQSIGAKIMEKVNTQFGITSSAHGTICAVPIEKAYKI
ncbi:MAG: hypothetical protein IKV36_01855 [Clostridia bacterium]|nr:hypothetical protein [Clostridia bacterium]